LHPMQVRYRAAPPPETYITQLNKLGYKYNS